MWLSSSRCILLVWGGPWWLSPPRRGWLVGVVSLGVSRGASLFLSVLCPLFPPLSRVRWGVGLLVPGRVVGRVLLWRWRRRVGFRGRALGPLAGAVGPGRVCQPAWPVRLRLVGRGRVGRSSGRVPGRRVPVRRRGRLLVLAGWPWWARVLGLAARFFVPRWGSVRRCWRLRSGPGGWWLCAPCWGGSPARSLSGGFSCPFLFRRRFGRLPAWRGRPLVLVPRVGPWSRPAGRCRARFWWRGLRRWPWPGCLPVAGLVVCPVAVVAASFAVGRRACSRFLCPSRGCLVVSSASGFRAALRALALFAAGASPVALPPSSRCASACLLGSPSSPLAALGFVSAARAAAARSFFVGLGWPVSGASGVGAFVVVVALRPSSAPAAAAAALRWSRAAPSAQRGPVWGVLCGC